MTFPETRTEKALYSLRGVILRPLAVFSLSFFTVSCILFNIGGGSMLLPSLFFFILSALFAAFSLIKRSRKIISGTFAAAFALAFGIGCAFLFSYVTYTTRLAPYLDLDGQTVPFSGHVEEVSYSKPYTGVYVMETDRLGTKDERIRIELNAGGGFVRGDVIRGNAEIKLPYNENGKPTGFGKALLADSIVLQAYSEDTHLAGTYTFPFFGKLRDIRSRLTSYLVDMLGADNGGFSAALILGDRSYLPARVQRDFKRLGVSHILALSGMHLAVICSLLYFLTKPLNAYIRCAIQSGFVLFYMIFTGFSPSVARAGIMLLVASLAVLLKRKSDMVTSIGIAVTVITLIDPFAPGDVGLQLSAGAVMAIALATGRAKKRELKPLKHTAFLSPKRVLKAALSAVFISLAVIIFLLPLEYLYYSSVSPLAPFSSLVLSFFSSVLLWLLPLVFLFGPLPYLGDAIIFIVSRLCGAVFGISSTLSRIPEVCVTIKYPFAPVLIALAFISFIVFAVTRKKVRLVSALMCLSFFLTLVGGGYAYTRKVRSDEMIVTSNHQKNDTVSVLCGGKASVIDVSDGQLPNISGGLSLTKDCSYTEIEALVLTHLHNYYRTTLKTVFDEHIVRELYVPYTGEYEGLILQLRELCREYAVGFYAFIPGDVLTFDSFELTTCGYGHLSRSVQPMVRFDLSARDKKFIYLSSSYSELCPGETLCADAVFLGDHGPLYKKDVDLDLSRAPNIIFYDAAQPFFGGDSAPAAFSLTK